MSSKKSYVFIDSSNLFYGGKGKYTSRIDYKSLSSYLKSKYNAKRIFYYSGVEAHGYIPTLSSLDQYPVNNLTFYLESQLNISKGKEKEYLIKDIARAKFLEKIQSFGYILRLKPVKHIKSFDGSIKSKSNCDVDLTFDAIRLINEYDSIILCSGDGDFEILLRYLKEKGKKILIVSNIENTAGIYKKKYTKELTSFRNITKSLEKNNWEDAP